MECVKLEIDLVNVNTLERQRITQFTKECDKKEKFESAEERREFMQPIIDGLQKMK